mgnify:CR=1 FL=1
MRIQHPTLIIKLSNEEINIKDITLTLCYGNKKLKQLITQYHQGIKDNVKLVDFFCKMKFQNINISPVMVFGIII